MGLFKRIMDFFRMLFSGFVDSAEESVPLERRLAYDRSKRAGNLKKQMDAATDVGQAAELMVQELAEARVIAANVRQEAKMHLQAAASAQARGDAATQQDEELRATQLSNELAEAEYDVQSLEAMVEDALSDKKEAIVMVIDQSKELEKLARGDSRLIARARMTEMRGQQLQLREQMLELVPGDRDNIRARIQESVNKDETRVHARKDVVDAMSDAQRATRRAEQGRVTAAGAIRLEELKAEIGYSTAPAAPPPPVQTEAPPKSAEAGGGGGAGMS